MVGNYLPKSQDNSALFNWTAMLILSLMCYELQQNQLRFSFYSKFKFFAYEFSIFLSTFAMLSLLSGM